MVALQVGMCQEVHSSVTVSSEKYKHELSRHNYVTPTSYLELLGIFQNLIEVKKKEVELSRNRTKTGLDKVFCRIFCSVDFSIR